MRFLTKLSTGLTQLLDFITTFTGSPNQAIQTNSLGFVDASLIPVGAGLPLGTVNGDILTWDGSQWITTRPRMSWMWPSYRGSARSQLEPMRRNADTTTLEEPWDTPVDARIKYIIGDKANTADFRAYLYINGALNSTYDILTSPTIFNNVNIDLLAGDEVYLQVERIGAGNANKPIIDLFVQEAYSTELLNR